MEPEKLARRVVAELTQERPAGNIRGVNTTFHLRWLQRLPRATAGEILMQTLERMHDCTPEGWEMPVGETTHAGIVIMRATVTGGVLPSHANEWLKESDR